MRMKQMMHEEFDTESADIKTDFTICTEVYQNATYSIHWTDTAMFVLD